MQRVDFVDDVQDDEIDLLKLVSSSADVTNQYTLFEGVGGELYAINVAKVEELFSYKKEQFLKNSSNPLIHAMSEIRSHITPVVLFDAWYDGCEVDENLYGLIILCHFSSRYIALAVKEVLDIVTIEPEEMQNSADMHELTTFVANIQLGSQQRLCTIFDTDRLLYDLFGDDTNAQSSDEKKIDSKEYILFADDSLLVRKMAQKSFEELGANYRIYEDGLELIEALQKMQSEDIGLFLLDLEMPRKSGLEVIDFLKKEQKYEHIPIVVHTNMANATIVETLQKRGVKEVIHKIDFRAIKESIRGYMA